MHATATHLLVYATARVLSANGKLHQVVAGNRRHYPSDVDIGLSITGDSFIAPVLVIERAQEKSVAEIVTEVADASPGSAAGRRADAATPAALGTARPIWFPAARAFAGALHEPDVQAERRRDISDLDRAGGLGHVLSFSTAGVLMAGQTRSRVVAVDGRPEVRPMLTLTLCGDHGVWDGRASVRVLAAVKAELEGHGGQTKRDERREASRP